MIELTADLYVIGFSVQKHMIVSPVISGTPHLISHGSHDLILAVHNGFSRQCIQMCLVFCSLLKIY